MIKKYIIFNIISLISLSTTAFCEVKTKDSQPPISKNFLFMAEENKNLSTLWKSVRKDKNSICEKSVSQMQCFTNSAIKLSPKTPAFFPIYMALLTNLSGVGKSKEASHENRYELMRQAVSTFKEMRLDSLYSSTLKASNDDESLEIKLLQKEEKEALAESLARLKQTLEPGLSALEADLKRNPASTKSPRKEDLDSIRTELNALTVK